MLKPKYVAPAAMTALTAATIVRRARKHHEETQRPHGIRRLARKR